MTKFPGYERRTVPTANLRAGDHIYAAPGFVMPIARIARLGDVTVLTVGPWESYGRRRYTTVTRKTAGKSTIHVRLES